MIVANTALNLNQIAWRRIKTYTKGTLYATLFSNLDNKSTHYCILKKELNYGSTHIVFDTNSNSIKGDFNENHVEGILFRKVTYSDIFETFEMSGIYFISNASP